MHKCFCAQIEYIPEHILNKSVLGKLQVPDIIRNYQTGCWILQAGEGRNENFIKQLYYNHFS